MQRKLFWILFFVLQQNSEQIIRMKEFEVDKAMADSVSKVVALLGRLKVAFWYSAGNDRDLISDILIRIHTPVLLNAVELSKNLRSLQAVVSSEVVIIFSDLNVDRVINETVWNGDTRFLVVANELKNVETDLKNFWERKVINIFELLKQGENVNVYGFLPFSKANCSSVNPEIVDIYESNVGNFANNGFAFKDVTRIKNMNGCPVNITIVDVKPNVMFQDESGCNSSTHVHGIEGNLMNAVAKEFNFKATFVIALDGVGWGWIHPSPRGAVGEVFTGRSDFAVGLLAPTVERYENLDISLPYNGEECITYGVPTGAGASSPDWITILIFEYSPVTWALIFISFLLMITFFEFVSKFLPEKWLPIKTDVILFVFSSCFGLPVNIPNDLFLRLTLICWIVFSFIITVAYRSSMGSKLTVPKKDPDINTFQELLDSELEFTGYNNMLRILQFSDETTIQKMIHRFKVTNYDIDYAVDRIAAERKIAHVRHTSTFLYYALINPKAKGHIHVIKDCIYLFHPMVVTKKHSPFSNRLNQLISRLRESGITKKWRSDYIYDVPPPTKPFLALSKDHMYGVFCILCSGYILGLLVFFIEVIYFRYNQ